MEYNKNIFEISSKKNKDTIIVSTKLKKPLTKDISDKLTISLLNHKNKIQIPIIAKTSSQIKISNERVDFGKIKYDDQTSKSISISSQIPLDVKIVDIRSYLDGEPVSKNQQLLTAKINKTSPKIQKITFQLKSNDELHGDFYSKVFIQTSAGNTEVINLYGFIFAKHR